MMEQIMTAIIMVTECDGYEWFFGAWKVLSTMRYDEFVHIKVDVGNRSKWMGTANC